LATLHLATCCFGMYNMGKVANMVSENPGKESFLRKKKS
jgi:hypothetical protein